MLSTVCDLPSLSKQVDLIVFMLFKNIMNIPLKLCKDVNQNKLSFYVAGISRNDDEKIYSVFVATKHGILYFVEYAKPSLVIYRFISVLIGKWKNIQHDGC